MRSKTFWAVECKMTCLGGSEQGTCPCERPSDCVGQNDSGYAHARIEAIARMGRYLANYLHPRLAKEAK